MEIINLYTDLLHYPEAPMSYRKLADYYKKKGMQQEAKAFQDLLVARFGETEILYVDSPDTNEKQ